VGDFVADWAAKSGKTAAQVEAEFFLNARPTSLLKRFTTPAEVAAMVTYVASPRSAATTGAALRADGGTVKSAF
jgi:NAD(P)-dependent dehydrogenase (short-subunit alcohol dehydrogenase family)